MQQQYQQKLSNNHNEMCNHQNSENNINNLNNMNNNQQNIYCRPQPSPSPLSSNTPPQLIHSVSPAGTNYDRNYPSPPSQQSTQQLFVPLIDCPSTSTITTPSASIPIPVSLSPKMPNIVVCDVLYSFIRLIVNNIFHNDHIIMVIFRAKRRVNKMDSFPIQIANNFSFQFHQKLS